MLIACFEMIIASVARAHGKVPGAVEMRTSSTKEELAFQYEQWKTYVSKLNAAGQRRNKNRCSQLLEEAQQTMFGVLRQGAFGFQLGFGIEPDRRATVCELERDAPLTFKGRHGRIREVAIAAGLTETEYAEKHENKSAYEKWLKLNGAMIASPAYVHAEVSMLFEAGTGTHKTGAFADISLSGDQRKLKFKDGRYDAFLVSRTFSRTADPLTSSMSREVQPIDENIDFPRKEKLHIFSNNQKSLTSMFSHGLEATGMRR